MSAIAGVYCLDGRSVDGAELDRMVAILAHRGPDGAGVWRKGLVGLGHSILWTTPESRWETFPLISNAGELVLTADVRIDNRHELIAALHLGDRSPAAITDGELLLAAYERWRERCPERVLGYFAFAIWDKRKQMLFCARDHFGIKPFYYYRSDRLFAFASEIKALLCVSGVPSRLNEVRLADYLASVFDDTAITFYQHILRLPPAHSMTVSPEGTRLQSYWSLDPSRELRLGSDEEYAETFRELFTEAVRCRLRTIFPVGSLLSGGLDSSSITCVARQLITQDSRRRLLTFSAIFDEIPQCDERPFIHAVLAQDGLESHYVHGDHLSPLTDLCRVLWHQDEAFYAPNLFLHWGLYRAARGQGVRVLLDGFDGDTTVSHGIGYLHELARAGQWVTLVREIRGYARNFDLSSRKLLWHHVWRYRLDPLISGSQTLKLVRRIWRAVAWEAYRRRHQSADRPAWSATLNPNFIQRLSLVERYQALRHAKSGPPQTEREQHHRTLTWGVMPFTLEVLDRAAAAFAIEPRYPFWDKRLVEFCLALPPEQKVHRGWTRMVLRRAMAGILPVEVQWRGSKSNLGPSFEHGLLTYERERLDEMILRNPGIVEKYVDITALREAYRRFILGKATEDVLVVWKAVSLGLWLQHKGLMP